MNDHTATEPPMAAPAVGAQVDRRVRPFAWMTGESARRLKRGGNGKGAVPVHGERSGLAKLPVYDQAALDAAVAAERDRCATIARRWGETHADGETVNARNAASKIARGIEGPNA